MHYEIQLYQGFYIVQKVDADGRQISVFVQGGPSGFDSVEEALGWIDEEAISLLDEKSHILSLLDEKKHISSEAEHLSFNEANYSAWLKTAGSPTWRDKEEVDANAQKWIAKRRESQIARSRRAHRM